MQRLFAGPGLIKYQIKLIAASRGVCLPAAALLGAAVLIAFGAAQVGLTLRSAADFDVEGRILDSGVLVGLSAPAVVLTSFTRDRSDWLIAGSSRNLRFWRALWIACLSIVSVALGAVLSALLPRQVSTELVFADFVALCLAGYLSAIVVGGRFAWIAPVGIALVSSSPRLLPMHLNLLVNANNVTGIWLFNSGALLGLVLLFGIFDECKFSSPRQEEEF